MGTSMIGGYLKKAALACAAVVVATGLAAGVAQAADATGKGFDDIIKRGKLIVGVSLSTLYAYVDSKGQPRPRAADLLKKRAVAAK